MYTHTHTGLTVATVDDQWAKERTCGNYHYLVMERGMSHCAFATREGFLNWMRERGLSLSVELAPHGEHSYQKIVGSYSDVAHLDEEAFYLLDEVVEHIRVLDNGSYTLGFVTQDPTTGHRTIHFLNCNVARPHFDYQKSREACQ